MSTTATWASVSGGLATTTGPLVVTDHALGNVKVAPEAVFVGVSAATACADAASGESSSAADRKTVMRSMEITDDFATMAERRNARNHLAARRAQTW